MQRAGARADRPPTACATGDNGAVPVASAVVVERHHSEPDALHAVEERVNDLLGDGHLRFRAGASAGAAPQEVVKVVAGEQVDRRAIDLPGPVPRRVERGLGRRAAGAGDRRNGGGGAPGWVAPAGPVYLGRGAG